MKLQNIDCLLSSFLHYEHFNIRDDMHTKCLVIAYYYPPINNVGTNRTVRFVDLLKKGDRFEPVIQTVENPDLSVVTVDDISLSNEIEVWRSYSLNLGLVTNVLNGLVHRLLGYLGIDIERNPVRKLLFYPDIHIGWIPGCLVSSIRLVKQEKINLIYVSCSPFSASVTGVLLKKMFKLPLVLDFRDPWSFNDNIKGNKTSRRIHCLIEKWVLKHADYLIANTQSSCEVYKKKYPFLNGKLTYIYNGYNKIVPFTREKEKEFLVLYTGAIYDMQYLDYLFSAVKELYSKKKDIRLVFTGHSSYKAFDYAKKYDLQDIVTSEGFIDSNKLSELYSKASMLLFYNGFYKGHLKKEVIKSKLFDYIATGIPILALAPEGEHSKIISKYSPDSSIVNRDFESGIYSGLCDGYDKWVKGDIAVETDENYLSYFGAGYLTGQLEKVFDQALNNAKDS